MDSYVSNCAKAVSILFLVAVVLIAINVYNTFEHCKSDYDGTKHSICIICARESRRCSCHCDKEVTADLPK